MGRGRQTILGMPFGATHSTVWVGEGGLIERHVLLIIFRYVIWLDFERLPLEFWVKAVCSFLTYFHYLSYFIIASQSSPTRKTVIDRRQLLSLYVWKLNILSGLNGFYMYIESIRGIGLSDLVIERQNILSVLPFFRPSLCLFLIPLSNEMEQFFYHCFVLYFAVI